MPLKLRKELILKNKLFVIKLSSLAVTFEHGKVNFEQIKEIVKDIHTLIKTLNLNVIVVSSGAINAGRKFINPSEKYYMPDLQACSAVGQPILMHAFQEEFKKHNLQAAQILLTHENLKNKLRSHNIRGSIVSLLNNGVVPILNENDSVSFDEITVGDNDQLSAMICETMGADLLCMLTQADGLYTKNPEERDAEHISRVDFKDGLKGLNTQTRSSVGRGGMKTKLQAVRKLTPLGIHVLIGSYSKSSPILRLITKDKGTLFLADPLKSKRKKKFWILTRVRHQATIKIDHGAYLALEKNASLLPIGIISTSGKFHRGDSVEVKHKNKIVAIGITEYSSIEVEKIKKLKSNELTKVLNYVPSKVVIHKDNLILKKGHSYD